MKARQLFLILISLMMAIAFSTTGLADIGSDSFLPLPQQGLLIEYSIDYDAIDTSIDYSTLASDELTIIGNRILSLGLEASIYLNGTNSLMIMFPSSQFTALGYDGTTESVTQTLNMISCNGVLSFYDEDGNVVLDGSHIASAIVSQDTRTYQWGIDIRLDEEGTKLFAEITRNNIGKRIIVMLDDTILVCPVVNE